MARKERKGWKEGGRKEKGRVQEFRTGQMKGKEKKEGKHLAAILQVHRREAGGRERERSLMKSS